MERNGRAVALVWNRREDSAWGAGVMVLPPTTRSLRKSRRRSYLLVRREQEETMHPDANDDSNSKASLLPKIRKLFIT